MIGRSPPNPRTVIHFNCGLRTAERRQRSSKDRPAAQRTECAVRARCAYGAHFPLLRFSVALCDSLWTRIRSERISHLAVPPEDCDADSAFKSARLPLSPHARTGNQLSKWSSRAALDCPDSGEVEFLPLSLSARMLEMRIRRRKRANGITVKRSGECVHSAARSLAFGLLRSKAAEKILRMENKADNGN